MEELINQINESTTFVRILEVGAGVPIANEFFSYAGASKTVYSSESYYSRHAFVKEFGDCKHRAVSAENLKHINDHPSVIEDLKNGLYNTVLSTTFQVGDKTNTMSTHGWICINIAGESVRYFHISLHYPNSRIGHIKNIGEIGILLLHAKNNSIPNDCCVDIVLDENLQPLHKETLDFLSHSTSDTMSVFTTKGIDRIESITRDHDALIVYKGSFNPPSLSHKEIIESSINLYEGNKKGVFCLSYTTFQKGIQSVESFLERVELLNKLGYDVIISSKPLFKNTYDFIRLKYAGKIIFPQGVDTINRMANDYIHAIGKDKHNIFFDLKSFKNDFINTDFFIFQRDNEELNSLIQKNLVDSNLVRIIDSEHRGISSTKIRNLVNQGEFDKVKELVPTEIYEEVIKKRF